MFYSDSQIFGNDLRVIYMKSMNHEDVGEIEKYVEGQGESNRQERYKSCIVEEASTACVFIDYW